MSIRTKPLILALAVALAPALSGAVAFSQGQFDLDAAVNILKRPDFLAPSDRALLAQGGYVVEEGFIRLPGQAPLTARQLQAVLAALKAGRGSAAYASVRAQGPVFALAPDQIQEAVDRVQALWSKGSAADPMGIVVAEGKVLAAAAPVSSYYHSGAAALRRGPEAYALARRMSANASPDGGQHSAAAAWPVQAQRFSGLPGGRNPARILAAAYQAAAQRNLSAAAYTATPAAAGGKTAEPPSPGLGKATPGSASQPAHTTAQTSLVASVSFSESMINKGIAVLLNEYVKTPYLKDLSVSFAPPEGKDKRGMITLHGLFRVPVEELQSIGIDKDLGDFRFQAAVQVTATNEGYLILLFPREQSFFYAANSANPETDRVVIPVQFLSLALASVRGYLATLSGDYTVFDMMTQQLNAKIAELDRQTASAPDDKARQALQDARQLLSLRLQAVPIQKRQAERIAAEMGTLLGFVGQKDLNLNKQFDAIRNALILRLNLEQLTPYLKGIQLGGIRIVKSDQEGSSETFLTIDINSQLTK